MRRSQDIQTLEDKDIRGGYLNALVGDDVVVQMRILRCRDTLSARLDPRNELQQGSTIVGLRESLAVHDAASLQLRLGV